MCSSPPPLQPHPIPSHTPTPLPSSLSSLPPFQVLDLIFAIVYGHSICVHIPKICRRTLVDPNHYCTAIKEYIELKIGRGMKYLESSGLETISNYLTGREMGGCVLDGRIEAFSCKRAGEDKKLSKLLEAKLVEDLTINHTVRKRSTSLGDLNEVSTRRLLIDLISTLNASFPDYDFSNATTESFVQRDMKYMLQSVNSYLAELTASNVSILEELWRAVDEAIVLRECEMFSYVPDMNEDPFSDGILWSFNFFIFNKELKRLCYFTCLSRSALRQDGICDDDDDDDLYGYAADDDDDDMEEM